MASSREIDAFLAGVERRAYKQALFTIQDHHVALDVVQNAMLKLVERYHDKPAEELPPLFQRILQNTIHDHFRRTKVREFWVRLVSPLRDKDAENSETLESLAAASEATHQPSPEKEATSNQPCLSGCHTHPLDVVARDFAAWRRRLGKAKRAQQRAGSLGTLRFAQPTSLPVVGGCVNPISTQSTSCRDRTGAFRIAAASTRGLPVTLLGGTRCGRNRQSHGMHRGHAVLTWVLEHAQIALPLALALLLAGWWFVQSLPHPYSPETDILLLTGDLPPDAYADKTFSQWLETHATF